MSLLKDLKITEELMAKYSPLGQLSPKYLSQLIKKSKVITFDAGEQVFGKQQMLDDLYFLLSGKLKIKTGIFSSEILDAKAPNCLSAINNKIPQGASAKAAEKGHILSVDEQFLDRALGWTEVERDQLNNSKQAEHADSAENSYHVEQTNQEEANEEPQQFDEDHFTWITGLMEFPLFFNLPPSNMEVLLTKFCRQEVSSDQVIIKEGDEGDFFYLLVEGSARVIIGGDESRPIRLNRGSFFGEEALISDNVRSATVIMDEDGVLARLDKASFQSLLNDPLVSHISKAEFEIETANGAAYTLLDIRSESEFEQDEPQGNLNIPLSELRQKLAQLDNNRIYYLTAEGGHRSDVAAHLLCQHSFTAKVIRS